MTPLNKKVVRETLETWDHRGRRIIVELAPPNLISFREKGTRTRWTATVRSVMQKLIEYGFKEKTGRRPRRGLLRISRHA